VPERHSPTIGILLCAGRNDNVVRYSLAGTTAPLAVADYTYDALPASARDAVPADTELATAAGAILTELNAADPPGKPPEPTASHNRRQDDSTRH
jgi:hypothetical protein